jgi:hypothetical protein
MQIKSYPKQDARAEIPGLEPGFSSAPPLGIPEGFGKLKQRGLHNPAFHLIQDEVETVRPCPILSISGRNLASFRTRGISRVNFVDSSNLSSKIRIEPL